MLKSDGRRLCSSLLQVYELLASDEALLNDTLVIKTADHGEVSAADCLLICIEWRTYLSRPGKGVGGADSPGNGD